MMRPPASRSDVPPNAHTSSLWYTAVGSSCTQAPCRRARRLHHYHSTRRRPRFLCGEGLRPPYPRLFSSSRTTVDASSQSRSHSSWQRAIVIRSVSVDSPVKRQASTGAVRLGACSRPRSASRAGRRRRPCRSPSRVSVAFYGGRRRLASHGRSRSRRVIVLLSCKLSLCSLSNGASACSCSAAADSLGAIYCCDGELLLTRWRRPLLLLLSWLVC